VIAADIGHHARIRPLDGVRGSAILLVLAHHLAASVQYEFGYDNIAFRLMEIGWCGVDLFFVLSGFLITGILYDSKQSNAYFRNFYARRTLRIFPLYYLALTVVLVLRLIWDQANLFGIANPTWMWFYLTNVIIARDGYGSFGVVDHFWSLAVEEHYYLMWPFVVLLLNRRQLMVVAGVICLLAPVARTVLTLADVSSAVVYMLTPVRMDSLALGAFIALAARGEYDAASLRNRAWVGLVVGGLAVCAIVVLGRTVSHDHPWMQSVGYSAMAVAFGGLLVLSITFGPARRLFSAGVLCWFGKYSYGMYVWHPIIFILVFHSERGRALRGGTEAWHALGSIAVAFAITLIITLLSWNLVEKQFLKLKRHFEAHTAPRSGTVNIAGVQGAS